MTNKTDKQFMFETQLNWLTDNKGILTSKNVSGSLYVATPPEFGGEGKSWSPEHLFLSSISSCFMTTYLSLARKLHFEISHFDCSIVGQIQMQDGKFRFSHINLYPKIYIADESLREKAGLALEKTHKYCIISNSVNAEIYYHSRIFIESLSDASSHITQSTAISTGSKVVEEANY